MPVSVTGAIAFPIGSQHAARGVAVQALHHFDAALVEFAHPVGFYSGPSSNGVSSSTSAALAPISSRSMPAQTVAP